MTPHRRLTLFTLLTLAACAPEAKPAEAPAPPSAPPSVTAAPAPPPAPPPGVSARVLAQGTSPESAKYTRLKVIFENPTPRACAFTGYTLRWSGGSKTFDLASFSVPAGETRERWGKVHPNDDGYAALAGADVATIAVEIKSDCPRK